MTSRLVPFSCDGATRGTTGLKRPSSVFRLPARLCQSIQEITVPSLGKSPVLRQGLSLVACSAPPDPVHVGDKTQDGPIELGLLGMML